MEVSIAKERPGKTSTQIGHLGKWIPAPGQRMGRRYLVVCLHLDDPQDGWNSLMRRWLLVETGMMGGGGGGGGGGGMIRVGDSLGVQCALIRRFIA
jgi:hypothetical protein